MKTTSAWFLISVALLPMAVAPFYNKGFENLWSKGVQYFSPRLSRSDVARNVPTPDYTATYVPDYKVTASAAKATSFHVETVTVSEGASPRVETVSVPDDTTSYAPDYSYAPTYTYVPAKRRAGRK
jgi:hypothetical protein